MTDGRNYAQEIAIALGKADAQTLGVLAMELLASLSEARGTIRVLEDRIAHGARGVELPAEQRRRSGYVYYMRDGDSVKIGHSRNPWARLREIRTSRPHVSLVGMEQGDAVTEKARHAQFRAHGIGREWFRWCEEIAVHVAAVAVVVNDGSGAPAFSPTPPFSPPASTALHRAKLPDMENALALRLPTNAGRNALSSVLRNCGDGVSVVTEIGMILDGGRPSVSSRAEHVELALCDYAANESKWSSVAFRAYVQRAAQPPKPAANGNGQHRGGTGQRSYDNAREALRDL